MVDPLTFRSSPLQAQEACGPLEIDSALGLVQSLERDLQEAKAAARDGKLKPLPGETVRAQGRGDAGWVLGWWGSHGGGGWRYSPPACPCSSLHRWRSVPRTWGTARKLSALPLLTSWEKWPRAMRTTQVLASTLGLGEGREPCQQPLTSPYPPGIAAREVAQALRSLSQAARGVAASTPDPQAQSAMLECASDVMDKANNLIEEARKAVAKPGDPESQQRLAQVGGAGTPVPPTSLWEGHGAGQGDGDHSLLLHRWPRRCHRP